MRESEARSGVVLQEVDGWVPLIKAVIADVGLVGAAVSDCTALVAGWQGARSCVQEE